MKFWGKRRIVGGCTFLPEVRKGMIKKIYLLSEPANGNGGVILSSLCRLYLGEPYGAWISSEEILSQFNDDQLIDELARRRECRRR